ncbi:MAG TPA: hypothetical protein GXZ74_08000 [Tissierellia bacterium]|nr:hypothetical protein [Tissierellia bacterium]
MTTRQRRIVEWFLQSEDHLLLTGPRQIGKTTLVNWLDELYGPFAGYRSFRAGDATYLADRLGGTSFAIGHLIDEKMTPDVDGFSRATDLLRSLRDREHELIILDEVGFMERSVSEFVDEIIALAGRYRMLIVLRRDDHALADRLSELGDFDLFDLMAD